MKTLTAGDGERGPAVGRLVDDLPPLLEHVGEARAALGVVLHEQDRPSAGHRYDPRSEGNTRVTVVPSPGVLDSSTEPPC